MLNFPCINAVGVDESGEDEGPSLIVDPEDADDKRALPSKQDTWVPAH